LERANCCAGAEMYDQQIGPLWEVIGCSMRGASHLRSGLPNQDAIRWDLTYGPTGTSIGLAVADGHGSKKSFRSDRGSRFAVRVVADLLAEFQRGQGRKPNLSEIQRSIQIDLTRLIVQKWEESVDADWQSDPLRPEEAELLSSTERASVDANRLLAYGSTLLFVLLTPEYTLYLQLGDGEILTVDATGRIERPLPADDRQFANETVSLCSPGGIGGKRRSLTEQVGAWGDFRMRLVPTVSTDLPALILVTTDGYPNSSRTDADFMKVVAELLDIIRTEGLDYVRRELPGWLEEASRNGSGDDVTVGLIIGPGARLRNESSPPQTVTETLPNHEEST
jgi:hypothetical protein